MADEITIRRDGVSVAFSEPMRDTKGWLESYKVSLSSSGLAAAVRVENPPYGTDPVWFFSQIAEKWRGWEGEIAWRSLEAELDLIATSDSLGHISIEVSVRPDAYPAVWRATATVVVDAGELDNWREQFASFFYYEAQQIAPSDRVEKRGA